MYKYVSTECLQVCDSMRIRRHSFKTHHSLRTFAMYSNVRFMAFAIVRSSIHVTLSTI